MMYDIVLNMIPTHLVACINKGKIINLFSGITLENLE